MQPLTALVQYTSTSASLTLIQEFLQTTRRLPRGDLHEQDSSTIHLSPRKGL